MPHIKLAKYSLVIALAFVFLVFGIGKFTTPLAWIGFLPAWMDGLMGFSKNIWLQIIAVSEIAMAILITIPNHYVRKTGAVLIVLHLLAVLWQVGWNDIAVRDTGLLLSGIGLFFLA